MECSSAHVFDLVIMCASTMMSMSMMCRCRCWCWWWCRKAQASRARIPRSQLRLQQRWETKALPTAVKVLPTAPQERYQVSGFALVKMKSVSWKHRRLAILETWRTQKDRRCRTRCNHKQSTSGATRRQRMIAQRIVWMVVGVKPRSSEAAAAMATRQVF